jgi:alkylation response protein AidB-like acyl-CoA dehydrogenase
MTPADREALIDPVRRLLADRCTEADVRRIMDSPTGHDEALWRALAELGVPASAVAEEAGGLGLGAGEVGLVMEEAGAALLPAPLLSSVTAAALLANRDDPLLGDIAGGRVVAVAFAGSHDWTGRGATTVSGGRVTGDARFVPDAAIAEVVLIANDDGVFAVEAFAATPLPTFDRTRRMADVALDAPARQVAGAEAVAPALARAIVALAGEQAGIARTMLDRTVAYARERHQFGRAIGSFQAIKHMAADLLLESESATSAARDAARQLDEGAPTADAAVALAAFACADAAVRVCADGIQMHGGIAFTWDHPAHLYLRRARSGAQMFGDSDTWRERYLAALETQA